MQITDKINKNMFREYDIRGIYGSDITEDVAYTIGKSFGTYVKKYNSSKVLIGYDNRLSSPILAAALIKGVNDAGTDVVNLNLVTTPMYYFARKHLKINTGIMITASHNPKEYNGFKFALEEIGNSYGAEILKFRDFTLEQNFDSGSGETNEVDIKEEYINMIKNSINLGDRKIKAVIDCGNGTGSIIIKDIFNALGILYHPIFCDSDGTFPNHHPDPSVSSNMRFLQEKVVELGYDIGIGIDGDADRVGIVDEMGNIIPADLYMLIMYRYLNKNLKNRKALFDVKCSKTLIDELKKLDIEPVMYRTGNSYCNMMMQKGDFDFGGEYSGHVFFRDKFLGFDDGIYGGLRMIEVLSNIDKPLSSMLNNINKYISTEEMKFETNDDIKFSIVEKMKNYALNKNYNVIDIDGVRVEFDDGFALVRASNTGPNITARFEAKTNERLNELKDEFITVLEKLIKD